MSNASCKIMSLVGDSTTHIGWCPGCENFHLTLGFVQLTLSQQQFRHIHTLMEHAMKKLAGHNRGVDAAHLDASRDKRALH